MEFCHAITCGREIRTSNMTTKTLPPPTRPEWGDCRTIHTHFGISKSTLYRLAEEGKIRTSSLKERGKLRGKRLFSLDSIAAFIESRATGGGES